jgi:endogenous inhibitor of DNA gyrase (YacG/DUF329 family)
VICSEFLLFSKKLKFVTGVGGRNRFRCIIFQCYWEVPLMKCPICGAPASWKDNPSRPFCSERCKVIDLGRWAGEDYRVSVPLRDVSEDVEQEPEYQESK